MAPIARAQRAARTRNPKTWRPLARARRVSRRAAPGKTPRPPEVCKPTPCGAIDGITGWCLYFCAGGVLMVTGPRCVGPECRGSKPGATPVLGFAGDIGAGTKGSFLLAGRTEGVTAMDGVEIAKGLAEIEGLRQRGEIDNYYAASAKNAYLQQIGEEPERAAPFEGPSALGRVLAPSALAKLTRGRTGEDVGPSVSEACRCTPRDFDAIDPVSGWGIYFIGTGVLLTPTKKCIGGGGHSLGFWAQTWRNTLALVKPAPPVPPRPPLAPPAPAPVPGQPAPAPAPGPPKMYRCWNPNIWPGKWREQLTPCEAPMIPYPE